MFTEWLVALGFGGFYRYTQLEDLLAETTTRQISGPYRTLAAARGPTWHVRLYFRSLWIAYHFRPPPGACAPIEITAEP
jgi:hypothetical protein